MNNMSIMNIMKIMKINAWMAMAGTVPALVIRFVAVQKGLNEMFFCWV